MKSKIHKNKKSKLKRLNEKIILSLLSVTILISCKDDTKEKVKAATQAVSADMKVVLDSAKVKASKIIDTAKVKEKAKVIIGKGAEKLEQGAKKLKESVNK